MMTIQTPLHAEHQLDQLAGQFAHWRQTRPHPHSPIPAELWAHAVALTTVVSPSRVAKQLRLRLADLKKQMATRHAAPTAMPHPPTALGFVEVPPVPARSQATPTMQLELSRADGARLCIHGAESILPLEMVVRAFLEMR
jgi:hypothetical protein